MTDLLLPDEIVIPDGIEPIVGWKAFNVQSGRLFSPSQGTGWPVKQRAEATCTHLSYGWEPTSDIPNIPTEEDGITFSTMTTNSGNIQIKVNPKIGYYGQKDVAVNNPMPRVELPPGLQWSWEGRAHDVVAEWCGCGFYIGSSAEACIQYCRGSVILCKVAVWGRVVQGPHGTRGQYAYPQSIEFAMGLNSTEIVAVAETYGLSLPPSGKVRNPRENGKFVLVSKVAPLAPPPAPAPTRDDRATAVANLTTFVSELSNIEQDKEPSSKRNVFAGISMILSFFAMIAAVILVQNVIVICLLAAAMLLIAIALTTVSDKS